MHLQFSFLKNKEITNLRAASMPLPSLELAHDCAAHTRPSQESDHYTIRSMCWFGQWKALPYDQRQSFSHSVFSSLHAWFLVEPWQFENEPECTKPGGWSNSSNSQNSWEPYLLCCYMTFILLTIFELLGVTDTCCWHFEADESLSDLSFITDRTENVWFIVCWPWWRDFNIGGLCVSRSWDRHVLEKKGDVVCFWRYHVCTRCKWGNQFNWSVSITLCLFLLSVLECNYVINNCL